MVTVMESLEALARASMAQVMTHKN
jgi:hypothetical protein